MSHKGGSRAAATTKMERFVIIVNGFKPLNVITKRSILDVAAALDPPLSQQFALLVLLIILSLQRMNYPCFGVGKQSTLLISSV